MRMHTASLASGTLLQEGRGTNALLPTCSFSFLSPSPSYPLFCPPLSLSLHDVVFNGRPFCQVMWNGQLSLAVGDMADVIHPHPLTRGGAVIVMWQTQGPLKGSDMAMVGDGDVAWLVGISISDEHTLT